MPLFFLYMRQMVQLLSISLEVFNLQQQLIAEQLQSQVLISGQNIQTVHGQISVVQHLLHLRFPVLIS